VRWPKRRWNDGALASRWRAGPSGSARPVIVTARTLRDQLRLEAEQGIHEILWRHAVHEAGHAVLGAALRLGRIERMAISASGGEPASRPVVSHGTLGDINNEICHDLAGRAAERLVFGEVSAGAGGPAASDLSQATRRALAIETTLGLGELGSLWMPAPETVLLTDEALRARVRARLEAAEARAFEILTTHEAHLLGLAKELLEKRSMAADEILPWVSAIQDGFPLPEGSMTTSRPDPSGP
jgi:cell division protease FtsH